MTKMRLNGTAIVNARLDRAMSQSELADKVGVSIPTIWRAEKSGGIHPSTAQSICKVLKLNLPDIRITVMPRSADPKRKTA
jgi:DNA-binding XRE family transcriptional regulator